MGSLLVILPDHVVGEERFARTGRTEDKFVAVGYHAGLHRQVGNIQMDRFPCQAVNHAHTERGKRVLAGGLLHEQA